jgi:hypothetical protein
MFNIVDYLSVHLLEFRGITCYKPLDVLKTLLGRTVNGLHSKQANVLLVLRKALERK